MNGRVTVASVPLRDDLWDVLLDGNPTDLQVQRVASPARMRSTALRAMSAVARLVW